MEGEGRGGKVLGGGGGGIRTKGNMLFSIVRALYIALEQCLYSIYTTRR